MSKTRKYKRYNAVCLYITKDVNSKANFVWDEKPKADYGLWIGEGNAKLISDYTLKMLGIGEISEGTCVEVKMMHETVRTDFLGRLIPVE